MVLEVINIICSTYINLQEINKLCFIMPNIQFVTSYRLIDTINCFRITTGQQVINKVY